MTLNPETVAKTMNQYIAERKFDAMIEDSEKIIDEYPRSYLGYWWKARSLTFKGDIGGALHWLFESIKRADIEEEESKISSSIANVYNIQKNWDESRNYSEIALTLNPKNVVAIIARSIALSATGGKQEATRLLESNMRLFKEDYQKACVYAVLRDKNKMMKHLGESIVSNPHQKVTVLYDPDFRLYLNDSDFRSLIA